MLKLKRVKPNTIEPDADGFVNDVPEEEEEEEKPAKKPKKKINWKKVGAGAAAVIGIGIGVAKILLSGSSDVVTGESFTSLPGTDEDSDPDVIDVEANEVHVEEAPMEEDAELPFN